MAVLNKIVGLAFDNPTILSSYHNLLSLHILAVDEAEHVNTRSGIDVDIGAAVDGFGTQDAACDVNHLQRGVAFVVDDPTAVAVESEDIIIADASGKHQFESAGVVGRVGFEAIACGVEQVDIVACQVVDEVEVGEAHFHAGKAEGVGAALFSFEANRDLTHIVNADYGIVFARLGDVDLGAVLLDLELGQLLAFIEADDGTVDDITAMAQVDHDFLAAVTALGFRSEGHSLLGILRVNEDTFQRFNTGPLGEDDLVAAFRVHDVEVSAVDRGVLREWVAYQVPA